MTDQVVKVRVESYLYNGPHRYYHRGRFTDQLHYDWRWKIIVNGKTIARRDGFCNWGRCTESAERTYNTLVQCKIIEGVSR